MIVRAAHPTEFAEVGDIRLAAYRADGFLTEHTGYAPTLRGLGTTGDGEVLVAVEDGRILGTIMLQQWPRAGEVVRGPQEAEIRALAVAPAARRQGTGRALVQAVIGQAAGRGVRDLLLCTLPEMRAAHRIYEQAGFVRLPERDWSPGPATRLMVYGLRLDGAGEQPDGIGQ
ncbi:MAG: GNAT family N-acetyltransferase [Actinomycetota bacterium]